MNNMIWCKSPLRHAAFALALACAACGGGTVTDTASAPTGQAAPNPFNSTSATAVAAEPIAFRPCCDASNDANR